jgi:hypothetical protein
MRPQFRENRRCGAAALAAVHRRLTALLLLSAIGAGAGPAYAAAQDAAQGNVADVAYVEDVSGRVVAFSAGKPTLLDALDVVSDRTRLDLQANSELRICHYQTRQLLTLKGPLRASISLDGIVVDNAKTALAGAGSCAAPVVSTFQGGIVSRGTAMKTMSVPPRPSIAVVNRSAQPIRKIALWDSDSQRILMTFDRAAARPILDEGQSYLLVVERNDGSEVRVMLQPSASTQADPLILVVR